ncbi:MAG TPA: uridine phosphorylase, partial [Mesotoga infera]|nr:uridine phosphorylase [Mesotoga infera]
MESINISKDHLKLSVDKLPDVLLLPGDPARVYEIGRFLDNVKEVGNNRDYLTIVGEYRGLPIAACSSGMGGPSTEIAVVELHKHGVNTIIRIGTSGGLSEKISPGDLIVLSGCIKYSGTANLFVPENFPSIADYRVLQALICA